MMVFTITSAIAIVIVLIARLLLRPRWEQLSRFFPSQLLHRWSLGILSLVALYIFFVLPFIIIGEYVVAITGFGLTTVYISFFARDIIDWIISDLRGHLVDNRGLFRHDDNCVVTKYYGSHKRINNDKNQR